MKKDCRVIISSKGREWQDKVSCDGTCEQTAQGVLICYSIENDACSLLVTDKEVFQSRKGQVELHLHFIPHQTTSCQLNLGGSMAGYSILTESYEFRKAKLGYDIHLVYLSGEDKERIELSLRAVYKYQELS